MTGFGTAGSILAGAAALFLLGSAIVAFRGWPRVAGQASPAAVQLGGGPVYGSPVSRRLRAVTTAVPALRAPLSRGVRRGGRRAPVRPSSPVALHTGTQPSGGPAAVRSGSVSVSHGGGTVLRAAQGAAGADITVTTPTKPPVKVTIPVQSVTSTAGAVVRQVGTVAPNPTGTAENVVKPPPSVAVGGG